MVVLPSRDSDCVPGDFIVVRGVDEEKQGEVCAENKVREGGLQVVYKTIAKE